MFYNPMQLPGMSDLSYCGGYYHHELVRTPDGWRSRQLREERVVRQRAGRRRKYTWKFARLASDNSRLELAAAQPQWFCGGA
jgi:hypothetical protein